MVLEMTNHQAVKENWGLYRAGQITLAELLERNDRLIFKDEIAELVPEEVKSAMKIMNGVAESERGCPADENERIPF